MTDFKEPKEKGKEKNQDFLLFWGLGRSGWWFLHRAMNGDANLTCVCITEAFTIVTERNIECTTSQDVHTWKVKYTFWPKLIIDEIKCEHKMVTFQVKNYFIRIWTGIWKVSGIWKFIRDCPWYE